MAVDEERLAKLRQRLQDLRDCQRITMELCRRSGVVEGFEWRIPVTRYYRGERIPTGKLSSHRDPPLPFWRGKSRQGYCRVCGQPIYGRNRSHQPHLRGLIGPRELGKNTWHRACVETYMLMMKPNDYAQYLVMAQDGLCTITGDPIGPPAADYIGHVEVDHDVPLFRVAREHGNEPWFELIRFWGLSNLRAVSRAGHVLKCAEEARERSKYKSVSAQQGALEL
jgi:hypothetical protein